jgi:hypothetical protein
MRRLKLAAAGLIMLVGLAGCTIASKVVVRPNGSGTYSVVMSVPNGSGNPGAALYGALQKAAANSNVPLQVTKYAAGGESGGEATFAFKSLADLDAESARLASSAGGLGVIIHRDGAGWHFSASSAQGLIAPPGASSKGVTGGPIDGSALAAIARISVLVQMPGAPGENNATAVTHTATATTFTWALSTARTASGLQASTTFVGNQGSVKLTDGITAVSAHSTDGPISGGGGLSTLDMGLIGGGVVVLLGAGAFVTTRRRSTALSSSNP